MTLRECRTADEISCVVPSGEYSSDTRESSVRSSSRSIHGGNSTSTSKRSRTYWNHRTTNTDHSTISLCLSSLETVDSRCPATIWSISGIRSPAVERSTEISSLDWDVHVQWERRYPSSSGNYPKDREIADGARKRGGREQRLRLVDGCVVHRGSAFPPLSEEEVLDVDLGHQLD